MFSLKARTRWNRIWEDISLRQASGQSMSVMHNHNSNKGATDRCSKTGFVSEELKNIMRYIQHINSDWSELIPKLRKKYHFLEEADLTVQEGQHDQLINSLSARLNMTNQQLIWLLNKL